MKKTLLALTVVATFFLSGCSNGDQVSVMKESAGVLDVATQGSAGSVVSSLKDAIGLGKKMECVSKDADGETKAYIDGSKYKSASITKDGTMISVFTGEDFYMWNEKTKEGLVMTKVCTDELNRSVPKVGGVDNSSINTEFQTTEDIVAEESIDNCKETGSIDFTIPTDVKFIDQCEMMKNIPASVKDFKIPAGQ